jgi:hypothetical protein
VESRRELPSAATASCSVFPIRWTTAACLAFCKVGVNVLEQTAALELIGGEHMTEQQFSIILFHLRAILGLVGIQASIMLGFAWKYL